MKINSRQLSWQGNELFRQGSRRPILSIEPDATYPSPHPPIDGRSVWARRLRDLVKLHLSDTVGVAGR
jgi:hypothetical protein